MEEDETVCVVLLPDDLEKLPPLPKTIAGSNRQIGEASAKIKFQNSENNFPKNRKSNPEIYRIFWRAYNYLREKNNSDPEYKEVWQAIFDDVENSKIKGPLAERRDFDPREIIDEIDQIGITNSTKLIWTVATAGGDISSMGNYSLSSLPALINKLKNNPPKI